VSLEKASLSPPISNKILELQFNEDGN
jgi:hypothetical protein